MKWVPTDPVPKAIVADSTSTQDMKHNRFGVLCKSALQVARFVISLQETQFREFWLPCKRRQSRQSFVVADVLRYISHTSTDHYRTLEMHCRDFGRPRQKRVCADSQKPYAPPEICPDAMRMGTSRHVPREVLRDCAGDYRKRFRISRSLECYTLPRSCTNSDWE